MGKTKKCPDCAEMVQREARKCRYCGFEFPSPPAKPKPSSQEQAQGCIILIVILGLLALVGQCAGGGGTETSTAPTRESSEVSEPAEPYAARLQREVDSLKKNPRLLDVPDTKQELLMNAVVIGARIKLYNDSPAQMTQKDEDVRKEFRRLQAAYQRDAFPKLRAAQAKVLDNVMWEQNVDVAAIGNRNSTLRFTGGIFASNQAVKVAQESISDTLEIMRFKRAQYEWFRGSEYQYYDRQPLPDETLADFTSANRWVKVE